MPPPAIPCSKDSDFKPNATAYAYCFFEKEVGRRACRLELGCRMVRGVDAGECQCRDATGCTAAGGSWKQATCGKGLISCPMCKGIREAKASGTCKGHLKMVIQHLAHQCCSSFPASVCQPDLQLAQPCKDQADFVPEAELTKVCDFGGAHPSARACGKAGCKAHGSAGCHCDDLMACKKLGGAVRTVTCRHASMGWDKGGDSLRKARERGSCEGITTSWGQPLEAAVPWYAGKCCSSAPASVCRPGA